MKDKSRWFDDKERAGRIQSSKHRERINKVLLDIVIDKENNLFCCDENVIKNICNLKIESWMKNSNGFLNFSMIRSLGRVLVADNVGDRFESGDDVNPMIMLELLERMPSEWYPDKGLKKELEEAIDWTDICKDANLGIRAFMSNTMFKFGMQSNWEKSSMDQTRSELESLVKTKIEKMMLCNGLSEEIKRTDTLTVKRRSL